MIRRATLLSLAMIGIFAPVSAEGPAEKGLRIMEDARSHRSGFQSNTATGRMVLRDRHGRESVREFRARSLEVENDGDKSMIIFERPRDIARTALLTFAHRFGDDDQWLFLPALQRVKRLRSTGRSSPFLASEFTYEDMIGQEVEKYTFKWIKDAPCPDAASLMCYVNEQYPKDDDSGYSRQVVWLDQTEYRIYRVEFFDRKGAHLKTLVVKGHEPFEGKLWRPTEMIMTNHQNGRSTVMSWQDYDFSVSLEADDFTRRALERIR